MWSFFIVSIALVGVATVAGLLYLPSKSTGLGVRLDVGLAWFAALLALVLTPTDVATALMGNSPTALASWWNGAYWTGFFIQIILLPIHMQFVVSGEFNLTDRLIASLRYNLLYYGVLLAITVMGLVLLLFSGRLQYTNIIGFCIAFSNSYGLIGAIFLMGFGLVAIPKQLWRSADLEAERRRICHVTGVQAERAADSHRRLSMTVLLARKTDILFPRHDPSRPYMDIVLALANSLGPDFKPSLVELPDEAEAEDFFDREDLARLRGRLKKAIKDNERERALYEEAVHQYLHLEKIQEMVDAEMPAPGSSLVERVEWYWHCTARFYVFRIASILAVMASFIIVVAEATISGALPNLSVASRILHGAAASGSQFITELFCFLLLAYPCAAAYYAIYKLGSFAFYRMVPRHTDAYSLCYSGLFMCRFSTPLAFNFMAAIALPIAGSKASTGIADVTSTQFYQQFGELMMQQPLIGLQFTTFAPALLVPYVLLLASGLFDRLVGLVYQKSGANIQFEDDWETATKYAAMGKRLLRMESENNRRGLAVGLPIEAPEAIAGPSLVQYSNGGNTNNTRDDDNGQGGNGWWSRTLVSVGLKSPTSSSDQYTRSRSSIPRSSEAEAARTRLSRALQGSNSTTMQPSTASAAADSVALPLLERGGGNHNSSDTAAGGDIFGRINDEWSYRKRYESG